MNARALSGRSHGSLGYFPFVGREGRQNFLLLTRRDPEVIECASQLSRDLIELLRGDVEVAMVSSGPREVLPGFVAVKAWEVERTFDQPSSAITDSGMSKFA